MKRLVVGLWGDNKTMRYVGGISRLVSGLVVAGLFFGSGWAEAAPQLPWGAATELNQEYRGQKVVFDTPEGRLERLISVLDRASFISTLNGADPFDTKIVIMLHGGAIPFFAAENYERNKVLMTRAYSLSVGGVIEFRMCRASAQLQGYKAKDIHGFVKMVPMADAEIVRLQQEEGYAYMQ